MAADRKIVSIVAMGRSRDDFTSARLLPDGPAIAQGDVWTINDCGVVYNSDLIFHMDPIWSIPGSMRVYEHAVKRNTPIITAHTRPDLPLLQQYPIDDVVKSVGMVYFNTTVAYAFAYAMHMGYTDIGLFGCDFTYPDIHVGEKGRACVEFWIGRATQGGVQVHVAPSSELMDTREGRTLYGFWKDPAVHPKDVPEGESACLSLDEFRAKRAAGE